jgi:hypothetical protein
MGDDLWRKTMALVTHGRQGHTRPLDAPTLTLS